MENDSLETLFGALGGSLRMGETRARESESVEGSGRNMISYYDFYFLRSSIGVNQFCLADVL